MRISGSRCRRLTVAATLLVASVVARSVRADDTDATPTPTSLVVVVESSDVAVGGAAVRNALGVRLGRPVESFLDATATHADLTLTIVVDRERHRAVVRLTDGRSRTAERRLGLPRPSAAAVSAITEVCATLLAQLGPDPEPIGRIIRDVRDPFAALPPPPAPRDEVLNPWPGGFAPHATRPPLASWPAGRAPQAASASADDARAGATTPSRAVGAEPASALAAPEPGFADVGDP